MSAQILALVSDLLFSSRIGETAKRLRFPLRVTRSVEDFEKALAESPRLIMVDLTARGLDTDAALRAVAAAGRPAPVLAWTTHALWKTTKPLHDRCDRVVTRETLTEELPDLLRRYLEGGGQDDGGHPDRDGDVREHGGSQDGDGT